MRNIEGTDRTRRFYDEHGWNTKAGVSGDRILFGAREDGPVRQALHALRIERIREIFRRTGERLEFLECGCGGNPEKAFLDLCSSYTGVDFSAAGIELARPALRDAPVPHELRTADVCALPFAEASFDAVYCAHMLYHIEDARAQEQALAEMMRVLKPGGTLVLVTANPRPLAFPLRLVRRLIAEAPLLGGLLNRLRREPPLPYRPKPIGWIRARLARCGTVAVQVYAIPCTVFNQRVSEFSAVGKLLWRAIRALQVRAPTLSAYLGNYVVVSCRKA